MEISNVSTAGSVSNDNNNNNRNSYNALTREKLFLLNLENNNKNSQLMNHKSSASSPSYLNNGYNVNYTTTPELSNSSSSSSLNSSESGANQTTSTGDTFYKFYNGSDSSIATVVQKLSSTHSDSTVNLQNAGDINERPKINEIKPGFEHEELVLNSVADDEISSIDQGSEIAESDIIINNGSSIPRSLKSSLKLPSLTRSRSLPSTKTVRFSSDLTKVKTFNEHAMPSSISLENSPDQSPPCYPTHNGRAYFDLNEDLFKNNSIPWYDQSSSEESTEEEDVFFYKTPSHDSRNKWKLKSMNFDLFRQSDPQAYVKLISLNISMDSIVGLVQVLNLSFEKQVEVKFTVDGWNSIYIINAVYDCSLGSTRDQFKFEINLNNSLMINSKKSKNQPISIELCVKFSTSLGAVFYDNNNSSNFKFQLVSNKNTGSNSTRSKRRPNHHQRSASSSTPTASIPSYIEDNFGSALLSPPVSENYSSNENYTTSRYFSDDTDYFNGKYFNGSTIQPKNTNSSSSSSSSSIPYWSSSASHDNYYGSTTSSSSNASTTSSSSSSSTIASATSNSSNETIKVSNNNNQSINNINAQSLQKSRQHYNEFLKKYCFFKSDNKKDVNESVFIR